MISIIFFILWYQNMKKVIYINKVEGFAVVIRQLYLFPRLYECFLSQMLPALAIETSTCLSCSSIMVDTFSGVKQLNI